MPNRAHCHDELAALMSDYKGQTLTAGEVTELFRKAYPHLAHEVPWIQASDHCINHTNKEPCHCAETEGAIFERPKRNTYVVR